MNQNPFCKSIVFTLTSLAVLLLFSLGIQAHPYASGVTNDNSTIRFIMNEAGATVNVVFEDNTTNAMGVLPKGAASFALGGHTSYQIICTKAGNGTPALISSDTFSNSIWANSRGVSVNQNAKRGHLFGRIYAGSGGTGGFAFGTAGYKPQGILAYNADQSDIAGMGIGTGTNSAGTAAFVPSGVNGPYRMRVAPDDTLLVTDYGSAGQAATPAALNSLYQFSPDLRSSNIILGPVSNPIGAGNHGNPFGTPIFTGSLAQGNLVLWMGDPNLAAPATATLGPGTSPGSYNCIFRYDIGAGPIPPGGWTAQPNFAYTMGLDGIPNLRTEIEIGKDGKIICGYGRANGSNPDIQILDPAGTTWLYTGGQNPPANQGPPGVDPWAGINGSGSAVGTYCGVRVSPDGRFLASVDINNGITLANLTNGIPDEASIFGIKNASNTGNSRGMDWDAADNIYVASSGQSLLRVYSLGLSTTCITSNDWTGTNGSFRLSLPPLDASVVATSPNASQNYGSPIPGVLRITLGTNSLPAPLTVNFTRSGTAVGPSGAVSSITVTNGGANYTIAPTVTVTGGGGSGAGGTATISGGAVTSVTITNIGTGYTSVPTIGFTGGGGGSNAAAFASLALVGGHYTINTNELPNGVTVGPNTVTFPAGAFAGSNGPNWNVDVKITPTASPLSTNTLTVVMQVLGGSAYLAGSPAKDTVYIQNTGPQLLLLSAAATGTSMYRGVTNDYAKFVITRYGDTNGPNNTLGNVTPRDFTVTSVSYFGTATYPGDYTARAQRLDPAGNGALVPPVDGPTAILIKAGDTAVTCAVGNPVRHTDLSLPPVDRTIIVNLTNAVACPGCTNLTSQEGYPYQVGTATAALTELDNTIGPESILWSNPLTNAADSVNWRLTYASTNFAPDPVLPAVFPNYANNNYGGGTNDFDVTFGRDISLDGLPQSQVMAANNWNSVLKMSVNKNNGAHAGVNVYPQGQNFSGNYALRFNMFISPYGFGLNNPGIGAPAREFALFGVNHRGTNCNWRTAAPIPSPGGGNSPTNSDGQWFAIGAASGSITPADFDAFVPEKLPNAGVTTDKVSNSALSQNGVFKHPPFDAMNVVSPTVGNPGGGEPVNKWVDVSVEVRQTNISVFINRSPVLSPFALTNGTLATSYTNGTIMLGYLDPVADISDYSAFAAFSNVRVVGLGPYIVQQPGLTNSLVSNLIVPQFSSLTFTSSAAFASAPITNTWYRGIGLGTSVTNGTPTAGLQTNTVNASSMTDTLTWTFNSNTDGTNYMSVYSDSAGSITSRVVSVEVVLGPTNKTYNGGTTTNLLVSAVGSFAPTAYQWYFNSSASNFSGAAKLANSTHYAGVTTSNLVFTNLTVCDSGYYWCAVTNAAGFVIPQAATLAVASSPPCAVVVTPASQTNLWGSTAQFTVSASGDAPFTYQWKKGGVNLTEGGNVLGATSNILTLFNITAASPGSYTAGVTNAFGGALSSAGVLTEVTPAPRINGSLLVSGGNVTLNFTTTNPNDTSSAFVLQSAGYVTNAPPTPFTNNPAGVFSGSNPNFQVVVPTGGSTMFYRLKHID